LFDFEEANLHAFIANAERRTPRRTVNGERLDGLIAVAASS
jgi:hypothetical protein